jgi:hypothetical protein
MCCECIGTLFSARAGSDQRDFVFVWLLPTISLSVGGLIAAMIRRPLMVTTETLLLNLAQRAIKSTINAIEIPAHWAPKEVAEFQSDADKWFIWEAARLIVFKDSAVKDLLSDMVKFLGQLIW